MELFLSTENTAFSVALVLLVLIFLLEVLSSGVISGFLDGLIPDFDADVDVPDIDVPEIEIDIDADADVDVEADVGEGASVPALSKLFIWVKGKVPMLVYFIIFLSSFSGIGLIGQFYIKKYTSHYFPWFIIVPASFVLSILISRYISKLCSHIAFKDESTAVSSDEFIGTLATITVGSTKRGLRAEARLKDKHGQQHLVYLEPEEDDAEFKAGDEVLIIRKEKDGTFRCIENEL